jgi:hypothetical protein
MQRATSKAREEFVALIVMHAVGPTGIGSQDERDRIQAAQRLLRYGATLGRIAENQCNGYSKLDSWHANTYQWDEQAAKRDELKEERIRAKVTKLCESIGCQPVFQGDPRGNTLKIAVPDGYTNDWGREGIAVPTS